MNVRRLIAICLMTLCSGLMAALASGSCSKQGQPDAEAVPPAPSTYVTQQALDPEVIEAALVDLLTASDEDSETLRSEHGKGRVTFSNSSRDWVGTLKQELASAQAEEWKSLGSPERDAAKEAAAIVIDRVENKRLFAPFRPRDPRIALWQDDPASTRPAERFPRGKARAIIAAPPGYADQRRVAVVVLSFAWSVHSGDATYVLRFDGKRWNVISRHFAYYV